MFLKPLLLVPKLIELGWITGKRIALGSVMGWPQPTELLTRSPVQWDRRERIGTAQVR